MRRLFCCIKKSYVPYQMLNADKLLFPENLMIQSYDIGVILGNALDNAMEACKKQKAAKQGAEFPATTKPDKKAHGIGLTNIKNTAEKYHGGVDCPFKIKISVFQGERSVSAKGKRNIYSHLMQKIVIWC